jgi:GNAT superfamily N-acetyltransferase
VITGFEYPDATGAGSGVPLPPRQAIEAAFAQCTQMPGFRAYLARVGGVAAGGGALRIDEGIAQLCGASTLPAYRRRGIQAALLRRRLQEARSNGCDLAIMTVQPGSKSHFNAQRQGFVLLYSRAVLVKTPPAANRYRAPSGALSHCP